MLVKANQSIAMMPRVSADTPSWDQGEATNKPIEEPNRVRSSERAVAIKAPAIIAAQSTYERPLETSISATTEVVAFRSGIGFAMVVLAEVQGAIGGSRARTQPESQRSNESQLRCRWFQC